MSLSNRCSSFAFGADNKGRCNGTKEREVCTCQGDRTLCDFYPDIREKAVKAFETEDTTKILKDFGVLDKDGRLSEVYRNIYELRKSQLKGVKPATDWNLELRETIINGEPVTAMHYVCNSCDFTILPSRVTKDYVYCPKCGREIKFNIDDLSV